MGNGVRNRAVPRIGLALSGGGLRGAAHIGVLKVFEQNGIKPDLIAGTSAGSIVAAFYAAGFNAQEIEDIVKRIKEDDIIDVNIGFARMMLRQIQALRKTPHSLGLKRRFFFLHNGLIKGNKIEKLLDRELGGKTLADSKLPLAIVSADINTAETVVFISPHCAGGINMDETVLLSQASLAQAVRSSIAIPGVFVPKEIDGHLLVDGGVKDNVPVEILHHMGADKIIAVSLAYEGKRNNRVDGIVEILLQTVDIMSHELSKIKTRQYADLVIRPMVHDLNGLSLYQIPSCIERGEQAARVMLPAILRLVRG